MQYYSNAKHAALYVAGFEAALAGKDAPRNAYAFTGWSFGFDQVAAAAERAR